MSRRSFLHALAIGGIVGSACVVGADDVVIPNSNLRVEGIPPISASLAAEVERYTEFRPRSVASWHPTRRELVVSTRATNTAQLFNVTAPLAPLSQITDYHEPVRFGAYLPRRPESLIFVRDAGGNEQSQIYRLDPGARESVLLTDPQRAHRPEGFNRARDRLLVRSVDLDKTGLRENPATDLALVDPVDPARTSILATLPGTGWGGFSFSFDDRRLAAVEFRSVNESYVWMIDVATGARARVFPREETASGRTIATSDVQFARSGKGLFLATDRDGEFLRSAYLDLDSGRLSYFGPPNSDVDDIALSPDGRTLAVVTNEAGVGALRIYDPDTRRELARPAIAVGTVSRVTWHENSRDLAFNLSSAQSPGDVWSVDVRDNRTERWTESKVPGLDPATFATPAPIEWKSFDGLPIHGFIIRPPASFKGPRPVLISIHGGPEAQARPGFMGRRNYFVNVMGITLIEPNVRGSTGYGKTYVALDNGIQREDAVKDIGALLDWIATQPDLDPRRVVVEGGSYGGYMSLAIAIRYADRIAGAIDSVGIANFVTFLERTESYRRDLRRVEYGDERDPAMRAFLTRISPVGGAKRIRTPLFVAHGRNDPRVPYTEAEQIVEIVRKNGVPTWYLLAANEGHGFARKENADYFFYAVVRFLSETLLP